jgi:hypothetical protein
MQTVTDQDIPIWLIASFQSVNPEILSPGSLVVSGIFSLSGPITKPNRTPVSGQVSGLADVQTDTGIVTFTVQQTENLSGLQEGDTAEAIIVNNGESTFVRLRDNNPALRAINWGKVFGIFKKVLLVVQKVVDGVLTIIAAVAPIVGVAAARISVPITLEMIGKRPYPIDPSSFPNAQAQAQAQTLSLTTEVETRDSENFTVPLSQTTYECLTEDEPYD